MLELQELLSQLGYATSPYYRRSVEQFEPETAHLFRCAKHAQVDGMYVVQASSARRRVATLPPRPAVMVASAATEQQARQIHRSMWNLGAAPFLIVVLPHQIRLYTAFEYGTGLGSDRHRRAERGLLSTLEDRAGLVTQLAHFTAAAIDTGQIWESVEYREGIDSQSVF